MEESDYDILKDLEDIKRKPDKKSRANTYLQSVIEEVENYLNWDNATLEEDRKLIYMKLSILAKKRSDTFVRLMIGWAKGKNLHPKQFIKAINKALL